MLDLYVKAMPSLQAQESINMINCIAYAMGAMDKSAAGRFRRKLVREAGGSRPPQRRIVVPPGMGIKPIVRNTKKNT